MMTFAARIFLFFTLLFAFAGGAFAQKPPSTKMRGLTISADESDRDTEADTLDLQGHVQIIFKEEHLSCEKARINFRAKTIDAIGRVVVVGPRATISGDRFYLDYESSTGVIYRGSVQSGNVYFEGGIITRTSETDYLAEGAKFTTCTNCPESWAFGGKRIRAELGGYAFIQSALLRFGGVPVFWLPYLVVPLKSDRQTGLLTPEFEISDTGGPTFSQSFFWAMGPSQDTTWTVKNYDYRGLKTLLNYRYVLSENSYGQMDVGQIRDRVFASDARLNQFRSSEEKDQVLNRWFIKYEHYYELPEGYIHRLQLNNASDLQYPKDFPLETLNHGDSAMENRMSLTKNTREQHFSLDSSYYINLLQADPLGGNADAVHRLPELRFSQAMSPLGESGFLYTADVDYTNFTRSDFSYDDMNGDYRTKDRHLDVGPTAGCASNALWYNDPNCRRQRDGSFDPSKDVIRTGQRLDYKGTIFRPIQLGNSLDLLPRVSYRETDYQFNVGSKDENGNDISSSNARRYVRADISARSIFSRIYGSQGPGSFERLKHEIEPEVSFTTIPWFQQPNHPFFGDQQETPFFSQSSISDSDLNTPYGIQFDYNDRVYDRKLLTFAVTNKFIQKRWVQGNPEYRQVVFWKLAQSYDFYQEESNIDKKQPLGDVLSDLRVNLDRFQVYQRLNYFPYQNVTNSSTRVRLLNDRADFVELAHLNLYTITPGQAASTATRAEDVSLSIRKNLSYLELLGRVTYDLNPADQTQKFKSYGYGAQVKLPGDCWYFTITQYRVTGGDNTFKVNFDFIWDGQKKPTLPESLLDSFGF